MFTIAFGLVLTATLLATAQSWTRRHAADLGAVSEQWVAAHNASRPSSST